MRTSATPRVLVGCADVGGFVTDLADGFRRNGCPTTIAITQPNGWIPPRPGTVDCGDDARAVDWRAIGRSLLRGAMPPARRSACRTPAERIMWLLTHHDVFVFVHASLWHDDVTDMASAGAGREYALLKALGKRIVSVFSGPDVRHPSAYDLQHARIGSAAWPMGDIRRTWRRIPFGYVLKNLRRAELHADVILSQPNQAGLAVRPYHHLFAPVDLDRYEYLVPRRDVPVVVHSASWPDIKGTTLINQTLQRLRDSGVRFVWRDLGGVPNQRLRREMTQADVVIDQIHLPLHGKLGVEAMASGCAVAACDRRAIEPFPADRPVWHIEPAVLEPQLRTLLTDRALRVRLAVEGRRYVSRYHRHDRIARSVLQLLAGKASELPMHHPRFYASEYRLPMGGRIPRPLLQLTNDVLASRGVPAGTNVTALVERGLLAGGDARLM
ncbi:MAG: hypothetical protein U0Q55_22760 [Vicinamibacterales bacterium]